MMYIDLSRDYILINGRVADMRNLAYIDDQAVVESMHHVLDGYLIKEDIGVASQTLGSLAGYGQDLLEWGVPKLLKYLKSFLPDTIEGWVHLGVDSISLVLDVLGPFTAGLGTAASAVIDLIHGLYYIGAAENWPGFPDRRDKEWEYLITGFITLGFAALPIGGNAGSIAFKTFLKKNPIGKNVVVWLDKLFASTVGKSIQKVFGWIFKQAGNLGKFFYNMFAKMTKLPIVGGIFKFFGNLIKDGIAKIANSLDSLLIKMFDKPGMKEWATKKFGKEFSDHAGKVLGKHIGETSKLAAKEILKTLPLYKAITGKLKMAITQVIADKVNITEGISACWALFAGKGVDAKNQTFSKLKELGIQPEKYNKWFLKYAFFIDESERDDDDLSKDDIIEIQKYLNEHAEVYNATDKPEETGELDAKTILSVRQLFQYLKEQDVSEMTGDDLENANELIKHCSDGLSELDTLDKGFFNGLKDKLTPASSEKKVSEGYLTDFKSFVK